jgi:hypothetical protein
MAPAHAADAPTTTAATNSTPSTTARVTPGKPTSNGGGPSVGLVVKEIAVGSTVSIRLSDFTAKVLTVTVCGNEGRRGSVDCNVPDAKTVEVPSDSKVFLADFIVTKPPAPCPCIIQAASDRFDEVAVAAFTAARGSSRFRSPSLPNRPTMACGRGHARALRVQRGTT